jgi:aldehyde dehydrogenase (NAD+)
MVGRTSGSGIVGKGGDRSMAVKPFFVNGEWRTGEGTFEVKSPYDESVVAEIGVPTDADVEEAIATAASTFEESRHLSVAARSTALDHISRRLAETADETAELIAYEGGKPLKWARVEAARAVSTFRWASEVLRHGDDELMRLDTEAAFGSRVGLLRRFPFGPVFGITPFNFPVNLVAHKVAPALAVGAPIVVSRPRPRRSGRSGWPSCSRRPSCRRACTRCCRCARAWPTGWRGTSGSARSRSPARPTSAGT